MSSPDPQVIFETDSMKVGRFRANPWMSSFRYSGPPGDHLFVFPREGVWIEHEGRRPFVADPTVVTFYNPGQQYRRSPISQRGDQSDWFALSPEILEEQFRALGLAVDDNGDEMFPFLNGPGNPQSYLQERLLVRRLRAGEPLDPLEVEERILSLASRVISDAAGRTEQDAAGNMPARHKRLAERARELLAGRFHERLSLAEIGHELNTSSFHLSRVFRGVTGLSLHQYRMRLRLSAGLVRLNEKSLTDLALDLGFSSHSHFSAAFHRLYGAPPRKVHDLSST